MKLLTTLFFAWLGLSLAHSQNTVTYAGNAGNEVFFDVMPLDDNHVVVVGGADDLDWIDPSVPRTTLNYATAIPNALGTGRYGFLLLLTADLQNLLHVVHFPEGAVEDIRFLKTNALPFHRAEDLYISCNTADTDANNGGYIIAKLNGNFIDAIPDACEWLQVVWAKTGPKDQHPWDVTSDGRVYYVSGEAHGYDWSAMYCLDNTGHRMPVEGWRTHWLTNGTEWHGFPASDNPLGTEGVNYSGIVMKTTGRCEWRSWNQEDFDSMSEDGNGGLKKGKWPLDILFSTPCDPANPTQLSPGYTGYQPESCCPVLGGSSITVDRRDNAVYLGMNMKSYSVEFNSPDFEPAVVKINNDGYMEWWSRLYHEITPAGDTMVSLPDQYVDALAIDYAHNELTVGARCHGNNTENFWEGNTIAANSNAYGFQNNFTGTFGNIHISWIGKLTLNSGTLMHSTYMAELFEGTAGLGTPSSDPNLNGWPTPNTGWPDVNTTRMAVNSMKVTSTGDVCVAAVGRRTLTTAQAYQPNVSPYSTATGAWNSFMRCYSFDLSNVKYSSLVVGVWDTLTGSGGGNTQLFGICKTSLGMIGVGRQTATNGLPDGNNIPINQVPSWGSEEPNHESAILVYYQSPELSNPSDTYQTTSAYLDPAPNFLHRAVTAYPIPCSNALHLIGVAPGQAFTIFDLQGSAIQSGYLNHATCHTHSLEPGMYLLQLADNRVVSFIKSE